MLAVLHAYESISPLPISQLIEVLGQQPGFITASARKWDAANGLWVGVEGLDRKSLAQSHFVIAHFGANVPYNAGALGLIKRHCGFIGQAESPLNVTRPLM